MGSNKLSSLPQPLITVTLPIKKTGNLHPSAERDKAPKDTNRLSGGTTPHDEIALLPPYKRFCSDAQVRLIIPTSVCCKTRQLEGEIKRSLISCAVSGCRGEIV